MDELQIFNYNGSQVRIIEKDGEPWWVLKDVCDVLRLSDTNKVAKRLDNDELTRNKFVLGEQTREMLCINESGLYNVILRSDKPEAKPFRKWVTSEVLPTIRKTGQYNIMPTDYNINKRTLTTDDYLKAASIIGTCRNERMPYVLGFLEQAGFNVPKVKELTAQDLLALRTEVVVLMRQMRDKYNLTQQQLANITGTSRVVINRYLTSKCRPSQETAVVMKRKLDEAVKQLENQS